MNYGKIYKIKNLLNGKEYVGQTTKASVYLRFNEHCKETRNNRHISSAIRFYGKENFTVEELASANNQNELNELEVFYVNKLNTLSPAGYNHRAGGFQNGKCSEELKAKISLAKAGKPVYVRRGEVRSLEQRLKISRSLGGKQIKATNVVTQEFFTLQTARSARSLGFNPSNVVQICKKSTGRKVHRGFTFEYVTQANQSGSIEIKNSEHAQRIDGEIKHSA